MNLPEGRSAIGVKWVFKMKTKADGSIERFKCRLVAKGFQQKEGLDYSEVFAPVAKAPTIRVLCAAAANKGWLVEQLDIKTAFLYGELNEEIYIQQPPGFEDGTNKVCLLKKVIYGLKQAPRKWYSKLWEELQGMGFNRSDCDEAMFMRGEESERVYMLVYVDDILVFSPSAAAIKHVVQLLQERFQCRSLGMVSYYLGLHIERDLHRGLMKVHQEKYITKLLERFGVRPNRDASTPFAYNFKVVKAAEGDGVDEESRRRFHSMVGSLMYAAVNTRPDISFAVGQLAQVVQCPTKDHIDAAERVIAYLGETPHAGVQYSITRQLK